LIQIGFEEMLELASYGAKMSPRSIELGAFYNVPIYVASSFSDATGTLIQLERDKVGMENRIKVTGIALNSNVAKITIRSVPDRPGIAAALFEPLASVGISVDTIVQNTSVDRTTDISFTVSRNDLPQAESQVNAVLDTLGAAALVTDSTLAAVSIVGSGMQNTPGYASRMFRVLADGQINIDMITTSEIRISCIIREDQAREAVRLLHRDFRLDEGTEDEEADDREAAADR
jgi:aspartate kinase